MPLVSCKSSVQNHNEQYSAQPILNNWCDNEHDGM